MNSVKSKRLEHFQTGIFASLTNKKNELEAKGKKIYNFFVGTPDFKTEEHIRNAISEACKDPENYKYTLVDMPELTKAVSDYYLKRYGVTVSPDCIASCNGSQEGLGHAPMAYCDAGDLILTPDPGYPIFEAGSFLSGADMYLYPLKEENHFLPDLKNIPEEIARKAKLMIVSYPYNPVCTLAPRSFYEELVAFAKKYDILIIHDNAYSDIVFDGNYGGSFLEIPGAMDVGVEFFSLSKSFNLTGARISFMVGNKAMVDAFRTLRSQVDFGMFKPIQIGAIAALTGPQDFVKEQCKKYEARRDALCGGFRSIGWNVPNSEGTMFVWAPIPKKYHTSVEFCLDLIDKTGIMCTPGTAFGEMGEGYVRFALTQPIEVVQEMLEVLDASGILR